MGYAALYLRLSRALDRDPETGELDRRNLPMQEAELRREAERLGLADVRVFEEPGASASRAQDEKRRVFYGDLIPSIKRGEVSHVLATEVDRLTRYTTAGLKFADLCGDHGVTIVCPGQVTLKPDDDRLLYVVLCSISESESKTRSRRALRYRERKREAGIEHIGGRRSYGYEFREGRGWVQVPREVKRIREAVDRALAGESLYKVTTDWNARGVPTALGHRWRPGGLRKVLTSRALLGSNGGKPIVSADEHELLRARLMVAGRTTIGRPRTLARRYPATGILKCGHCGSNLVGGGGAFRCVTINGGCGRMSVAAYPVERHLWNVAVERALAKIKREGRRASPPVRSDDERVRRQATAEVRKLEARVGQAEEDYAAGHLDGPGYRRILDLIETELERARQKLLASMPAREPKPMPVGDLDTLAEEYDERWRTHTLAQDEVDMLHEFLAAHVPRVIVHPAAGRKSPEDRVEIPD